METTQALTVAQAAHKANTSTKFIYAEIDRGHLLATRLGTRAFRITIESFDAWITGRSKSQDQRIADIVAASPPLTDEQIDDIVAIICAGRA